MKSSHLLFGLFKKNRKNIFCFFFNDLKIFHKISIVHMHVEIIIFIFVFVLCGNRHQTLQHSDGP